MHLYVPEVTRALDTTHTSTTDRTRTKPMTEIFIKNFHDEDAEFPTTNSPPTTNNTLETTILASAQTASRPTHADTTNDTTDALETTIFLQLKMLPTSMCHMTSLTSSATFHPLQLHSVYFQTEAISETSLHSSILSSKINKLLPTL
jgi:hypothetical protein